MATDLALLRRASASGRAVLRLYAWERPTVSFGRHETVNGAWDLTAIGAANMHAVRRPTGGRALLHAHDITFSVTLPLGAKVAWREVYDAVNARLLEALQRLGAPVSLSHGTPTPTPNGALCFAAPSEGEIMLGNEKVAGSAVWRAHGGYLQHGSILLHNAQHTLERFRTAKRLADVPDRADAGARQPATAPKDAPAHVLVCARTHVNAPSLASVLNASLHDAPSMQRAASDVARAIRETWSAPARDICTFEPSQEDIDAHTLAHHELAAPAWLWRR